MATAESWFGNAMETKYLVTLTFDEPHLWTEYNSLSYPGAAWKSLPGTKGMFYARVVQTGSTTENKARICLYHAVMKGVYGEDPIVAVKMSVSSEEDEPLGDVYDFEDKWYQTLTMDDLATKKYRTKEHFDKAGYLVRDVPMSTLLDNPTYARGKYFKVTFDIRITTEEIDCEQETHDSALQISFALAKRLTDPACADIEFICPSKEGDKKKLYAIRSILEIKSSYFSRMFNSQFSEGQPSLKLITNGYTSPLSNRLSLPQEDDFDLFHVVLFYLYTDRICFTTSADYTSTKDVPPTTDAEGIYAIADRLLLEPLASKALHFLESTCNARNITARAFGKFGYLHDAIGQMYDAFFMDHWDLVKQTNQFDEFFQELEEDNPEYIRANSKFRRMIKTRN